MFGVHFGSIYNSRSYLMIAIEYENTWNDERNSNPRCINAAQRRIGGETTTELSKRHSTTPAVTGWRSNSRIFNNATVLHTPQSFGTLFGSLCAGATKYLQVEYVVAKSSSKLMFEFAIFCVVCHRTGYLRRFFKESADVRKDFLERPQMSQQIF